MPRDTLGAAAIGMAPLLVIALIAIPWSRMATVIAGGLLVLGGDDSVGPVKIVYAGVVVLCVALSTLALFADRRSWFPGFRAVLISGTVLGLIVVGGAVFSPIPWNTPAVLRGSVFWLLIIAAPVLGVDAARSLSPRVVRCVVGLVGLVASIGFATHWLELRGVSALPIGHWLMPSVAIPAVGFTIAFVQTAVSRGRYRFAWAALTAAILVTMVVSGSRTNLLILTAIFGTLGARRLWRVPLRRSLSTLGLVVSIVFLAAPVLITVLITNPGFFATRIAAVTSVFSGGLGGDASFLMRENQQSVALSIIGAHPWFGYGSGWVLDQVLDTPWVTIVRIGLVGGAALIVFLVLCGVTIARSAVGGRSSVGHTVASGSAAFFLCLLPLASPVDDHGFGFALMLIFALVGSHVRTPEAVPAAKKHVAGAKQGRTRARGASAAPRDHHEQITRS